MRKIWKIAVREYLATVRTKAFIISLVMMPVFMGGGLLLSYLTERMEDRGEKKFAIVDRTPNRQVFSRLEQAVKHRNERTIIDEKTGARSSVAFGLVPIDLVPAEQIEQQRLELSERVRQGEFAGVLEIGPKALRSPLALAANLLMGKSEPDPGAEETEWSSDPAAVRYQAKPTVTGAREFYQWALVEVSLALAGVSRPNEDERAFRPPIVWLGLTDRDPKTGAILDDAGMARTAGPMFAAMGLIILMFMVVMVGATPLMQGVLEEKLNRIAEVLLGSVRPFELMLGKLLGGVGVSLTLAAAYLGGAYWALWHYNLADLVPPGLIAWFLFYQVLALLMNGSAFMAVGAACSDMKDPQTLMLPVMLPTMLPMFMLGPMLRQPEGVLTKAVSYFPPATPMMMVGRQAMSATIQWWEPIVGAVLVLATTLGCVWAAGRIFRVGLLMQGKAPRLGQMLSWVFKS